MGTAPLLLLAMCALWISDAKSNNNNNNKLLLIMVDGCRWDYPERDIANLPGFRKLEENGVKAQYTVPIFPANSYPNWYTIVTGLWAESHGFVQNMMYDPQYGDFFLMAPNETADVQHWWDGAEPLWVTAEKSGKRSALYWWDGCQVEIRGRKPTFCKKYKYVGYWPNVMKETKEALLTSLDLLENDEIQLVQIYYEPVDHYGHKYGPDSPELRKTVREADNLLDLAQKEMARRGLIDKVNLVVLSDHGMTATDPRDVTVIDLQDHIDLADIRYMVYYGANSMLLPQDGRIDKVYRALKGIPGLNVYLKEEIPEHYHLKNNRLTLPILLVANKNHIIRGLDYPGKSIPTGSSISMGSHGYDPDQVPDMRGIFYARGPGVKKGFHGPMQNVDIYNVLCDLLGIDPLPNNGTKSLASSIVALPLSSAGALRAAEAVSAAAATLLLLLWTPRVYLS